MQAVTISQLRRNLKKYLDEVSKSSDVMVVSRANEEEAVVILSLCEYNALTETAFLLNSADNRQRLHQSIEQVKKGRTREFKL